jgi:hypothetical protein
LLDVVPVQLDPVEATQHLKVIAVLTNHLEFIREKCDAPAAFNGNKLHGLLCQLQTKRLNRVPDVGNIRLDGTTNETCSVTIKAGTLGGKMKRAFGA